MLNELRLGLITGIRCSRSPSRYYLLRDNATSIPEDEARRGGENW
jgi:hypothetical protein